MSSELAGKVAIVTGGASGIGRAGVAALLGAGATVAGLDRDEAVSMPWSVTQKNRAAKRSR
jgi:3-hydroxybutyrate dehydrogenase